MLKFDAEEHVRRCQDRIARYRFVNWTLSVHTRVDVDVTPALAYLVRSGLDRADPPVTLEHLWLCACARVIRERPLFNANFDGYRGFHTQDEIHLRVSVPTPAGLAYGVIPNADKLDPVALAAMHRALSSTARPFDFVESPPPRLPGTFGRVVDSLADSMVEYFPPTQYVVGKRSGREAGTFTVLNVGVYGAEDLHAVVLRPSAALLVVLKPYDQIVSGPDGPEVRRKVPMAVPFDHMLMDTDAAGYFLFHLQEKLADPIEHLSAPETAEVSR